MKRNLVRRSPAGAAASRDQRRRLLLLVAMVAVAARLVYLAQAARSPFFSRPIVDAQTYDEMAVRIAAGEEPIPAPFFQPPLYPYALGLLYALFGRSLLLARLLQMAAGTASACLIFSLGEKIFGRRTGLAAALAFSLYGPMLFYEGELLAPALIVLLNLLLAGSALAAIAKPSAGRALVSGALLGLSALAMSVVLPMALVIPWCAWRSWRRRAALPAPGRGLALLGAFAAGLALVIAPVAWRNARVSGEFVPISTNGGINFFLGSGADFERKLAIRPGYEWDELLNEPIRRGIVSAGGQSDYFRRKALRLIAADPAGYGRVLLRKLRQLAAGGEIMRDIDLYAFRQYSPLLSLLAWKRGLAFPFGLLLPLALLGMALAVRRRLRGAGLLLAFVLAHAAVLLAFFVTSRYRLNVLPFLALFAAYGGLGLWDLLRSRRWRRALPAAAGTLLLLAFCNWRAGAMSREFSADACYNLGTRLLHEGKLEAARKWLLRATAAAPLDPGANGNLGVIHEREGRPQEARACYLRILARYPDDVRARLRLAGLCARLGELEQAGRHYDRVLGQEPENEEARLGRRRVQGLLRQREAAACNPLLRGILERLRARPDDPALLNDLGAAYVTSGYPDMAVEPLRLVIASGRFLSSAHNNLGIALAQLRDRAGAEREFRAALAADPRDARSAGNLAILLAGQGDGSPRR